MAFISANSRERIEKQKTLQRMLERNEEIDEDLSEHVRVQLRLDVLQEREVGLADGSCVSVPFAGPVVVRFKNRIGVVGALALGNEVLLGAIPLEDMDLVVNPRTRTVDVNSASPNIASGIVKRAA